MKVVWGDADEEGGGVRRVVLMVGAVLCLQLGEKQQELDRLQEQNLHLKEQLDEARGREHSAREGYVLQVAPDIRTHATQHHTHTPLAGVPSWFHLNHNNQNMRRAGWAQVRRKLCLDIGQFSKVAASSDISASMMRGLKASTEAWSTPQALFEGLYIVTSRRTVDGSKNVLVVV